MNLLAESNNVLLPPIDELILGLVTFFLVYLLLSKFALPGVRKALADRTDAIQGGIARAEQREAEAELLHRQYTEQLAQARTEAAEIRAAAQSERTAVIETARQEATEAAAAVTARAEAAIAADRATTIASLRREVGTIAVTLASKVVGESLSDDARAQATVDRFIADLEAQAGTGVNS
jgi:F-type H+-transporting ATPase subunit b